MPEVECLLENCAYTFRDVLDRDVHLRDVHEIRIEAVGGDRTGYRIAVRPDDRGQVDDVVVRGVSVFRMERMDQDWWFLSCNLEGKDGDNRIAFTIRGMVQTDARVVEWPRDVRYEEGSMRDPEEEERSDAEEG